MLGAPVPLKDYWHKKAKREEKMKTDETNSDTDTDKACFQSELIPNS